jgi:hypothetical protein
MLASRENRHPLPMLISRETRLGLCKRRMVSQAPADVLRPGFGRFWGCVAGFGSRGTGFAGVPASVWGSLWCHVDDICLLLCLSCSQQSGVSCSSARGSAATRMAPSPSTCNGSRTAASTARSASGSSPPLAVRMIPSWPAVLVRWWRRPAATRRSNGFASPIKLVPRPASGEPRWCGGSCGRRPSARSCVMWGGRIAGRMRCT